MNKIKNTYLFLIIVVFCNAQKSTLGKNAAFQKITFEENRGQIRDQCSNPRPDILFSAKCNNFSFFLKEDGFSYQIAKYESVIENKAATNNPLGKSMKLLPPHNTVLQRVDVKWIGANKNPSVQAGTKMEGYKNYYNVKGGEVLFVNSYSEITLKNIFDGIDVRYYEKDGNLEYDYIASAGASHKQIQFEIDGADNVTVGEHGELIIKTPLGSITENPPIVFQNNKVLKSNWAISGNKVAFEIENLDKNLPYVIDPSVLLREWGTYYGGDAGESCVFSATDKNGNIYICGQTESATLGLMATGGAYQFSVPPGTVSNYIAKFSPSGARLWATYYGDSQLYAAMATDANNNVILFGSTSGSNNISTPGSYQPACGGGEDSYLVKFNSAGVRQWATYYGGSGNDFSECCATDTAGNIFVYGYVMDNFSGSALSSPGCHQPASGGGNDLFIAKFSPGGSRLWGSYYGGAGTEYTGGCGTDDQGNFYFSGSSSSHNNIATVGSHQELHGDNNFIKQNGFLAKFNSAGSRLWATYYGGPDGTYGGVCTVLRDGSVIMGGDTNDTLVITTNGCYQPNLFGSNSYFVKFNSSGQRLWATYYGSGNNYCSLGALNTDVQGNIYAGGTTGDSANINFFVSADAYQSVFGGNYDAFMAKFTPDGNRIWGSLYGGAGRDYISSILPVTGSLGIIYIAGETSSPTTTRIASNNGYQTFYFNGPNNYSDAFIARFNDPLASVKELSVEKISVKIYPNPSGGELFVEADRNMKVDVINVLGQLIQSINIEASNGFQATIHNLEAGVYLLRSDSGEINARALIIK